MPSETQPHGEVETFHRERARNRLAEVTGSRWNDTTRLPFAQALHMYFDALPINWGAFTTDRQILAIVPSIYGALSYATFASTGQFPMDSNLDTPEKCRDALIGKATQPEFKVMLGELPVTFQTGRALPVSYIVRHLFREDPEIPRVYVDLGAGPGYMGPVLQNPELLKQYYSRSTSNLYDLYCHPSQLPIHCGINVDRLPKDEAILRSLVYGDDKKRLNINTFYANLDEDKFPHVITDLNQAEDSISKITTALKRKGRKHADVVIRSFVDYQVGGSQVLDGMTLALLADGGYCIRLGDELPDDMGNLRSAVSVFQKKNVDELEFIGMPFEITDDGTVTRTFMDFFRVPSVGRRDLYMEVT